MVIPALIVEILIAGASVVLDPYTIHKKIIAFDYQNKRRIVVSFMLFFVLIFAAIFSFIRYTQDTEKQKVPKTSFYDELVSSNKNFALGENLFNMQKYPDAIAAYETALKEAVTEKQKGQILYKIALATRENNDLLKAIRLFKEVAENNNYAPTARAYAVQSMVETSRIFSDNTNITPEIFKDDPYQKMFRESDADIAYRRLSEYASSFWPLGLSEMRVAQWYAEKIISLQEDTSMNDHDFDAVTIENYKTIIQKNMNNAGADILRTQGKPEIGGNYIPSILTLKANVLWTLSKGGDESFGDPETVFKQALESIGISPSREAQAKYYYAIFLSEKYGKERTVDIHNLLSDFYATNKYDDTGIVRFIKIEKNNAFKHKARILKLAEMDPEFKKWLSHLGWENL